MKRWVSGAMALILILSCAWGGFAFANEAAEETFADAPAIFDEAAEEEIVAAEVEEPVVADPGDAAASDPVEYEAALGEDADVAQEALPEEAPSDAPAVEAVYARVISESADIFNEGATIARLYADSTVLVLGEGVEIAFDTDRGVVTGTTAAENLYILTAEETAAYLDALAENGAVTAYDGDLNRPLERVACDFAEDEPSEVPEETDIAEQPAEDDAETAEEEANANDEEIVEAPIETPEPQVTETPTEAPDEPEATAEAADALVEVMEIETEAYLAATPAPTATAAADEAKTETLKINKAECVLGLKETYSGLAVSGNKSAVTWSSSNSKIVKVDAATGAVKGVKKGSATVTATTADGETVSARVTVKAAPKKIAFSPAKLSVGLSETSVLLKLKLTKGSASAGTTYTSSNEKVATVDASGVLTPRSTGTTVITAKSFNGKKASCTVKVSDKPAPVSIKMQSKVTIGLKESRDALDVELVSASGDSNCSATIAWKSSNKKVVKVNATTGALKGLKKGSATITAITDNGLKAKCKVTVKSAPKKVGLNSASGAISVGGTAQYSAKLPKGTASACTFTSSDTSVAIIDENGLATGVGNGQTTITVTTYNGKTAMASLKVGTSAGSGDDAASTDETPTDTGTKSDVSVPASLEKLGLASYQNVYSAGMSNAEKLEYVIYNAQNQLGMPYVYGKGYKTANPTGFDCSGFVYWCFYKLGIELGESAYKQGYDNRYTKISDIASLKRGDVVCFNTSNDSDLSDHTGIYLGNGYFIHASSGSTKRKVVVQRMYGDSISNDYYKRNFSWGRRILN